MRILLALVLAAAGLIAWLLLTPRRDLSGARVESDVALSEAEASPPREDGGLEEVEQPSAVSRAPEIAVSARASALPAPPTCRIVGRVLDDKDVPIAGASVTLCEWADFPEILATHETRSDADGRFTLTCAVPSGPKQSLEVGAPPFHEKYVRWFGALAASEGRALVAGDVDAGTIRLSRCGVVEGRVVTSEGLPIEIGVMLQSSSRNGLTGLTRPDGSFSIGEVPVDRWLVTVQTNEWTVPKKTVVEVEPMRITTAPDLVLTKSPTIDGLVADTQGQPMSGVFVSGQGLDAYPTAHARTEADGTFTLTLREATATTLSVAADCEQSGFAGQRDDPRATFEPGARGVRLVVKRAPVMTFRVVAAKSGAPIESFALKLHCGRPSSSFPSQPELNTALQFHPGGEVSRRCSENSHVTVEALGYARLELAARADPATPGVQTIALQRASSITGRVVLESGGSGRSAVPQGGANIYVSAMKHLGATEKWTRGEGWNVGLDAIARGAVPVSTDANGEFTVGELAPGSFALGIEAAGGARTTLLGVTVLPEREVALGDIVIAPEAIVRGLVRMARGESPVGMRILFDDRREVRVIEEDGRFEVRGLTAGPRWLVWRRQKEDGAIESQSPRRIDFSLVAGETREIVIDATASGPCWLTVRVTRHGSPVADALVILRAAGEEQPGSWTRKFTSTNADGVASGSTMGGERVDVLAMGTGGTVLGKSAVPLELVAGGSFECVIEVTTGTLRVQLPSALARPSEGRIVLGVPSDNSLSRTAFTPTKSGNVRRGSSFEWGTDSVDFGSFQCGEYHVDLKFERFERDEQAKNPKAGSWIQLREPFSATITIEDEKETRLLVP